MVTFELLKVVVGDDDCGYVVRRDVISDESFQAPEHLDGSTELLCVCCGSWIRIRIHCLWEIKTRYHVTHRLVAELDGFPDRNNNTAAVSANTTNTQRRC